VGAGVLRRERKGERGFPNTGGYNRKVGRRQVWAEGIIRRGTVERKKKKENVELLSWRP